MIRLMEMVIIIMLKAQLTKEAGMKINKKEGGERNGRIVLIMKENIISVNSVKLGLLPKRKTKKN